VDSPDLVEQFPFLEKWFPFPIYRADLEPLRREKFQQLKLQIKHEMQQFQTMKAPTTEEKIDFRDYQLQHYRSEYKSVVQEKVTTKTWRVSRLRVMQNFGASFLFCRLLPLTVYFDARGVKDAKDLPSQLRRKFGMFNVYSNPRSVPLFYVDLQGMNLTMQARELYYCLLKAYCRKGTVTSAGVVSLQNCQTNQVAKWWDDFRWLLSVPSVYHVDLRNSVFATKDGRKGSLKVLI
jgi:hypothetical protein